MSSDDVPRSGEVTTASEPALTFALHPDPSPVRRWMRAARILLGSPRETAAILRARMTGRRVRARQAWASLVGLDHRALWQKPRAGLDSDGIDPIPAGVEVRSIRDPVRPATAPILILDAPGHERLPGAAAAIRDAFARHPERQILYGDARLIRADGAALPLLRPAFDPDYMMAVDYIGPVIALRREAWDALAPGTTDAGRATDLILRVAARDGPGAIGHLPRVLSRVRLASVGEGGEPTRPSAHHAVVRQALDRTGQHAVATEQGADGILTLRRPLPPEPPLVSLIVPTRDRLDLLRPCITSLLDRTDWPAREILICDNDSAEPETQAYFRDLEARGQARIVSWPGAFDFAAMNNAAARAARGQVLAFVNNDVEAHQTDWLDRLVREALRPEIGAVGPKLIDGTGRIQHGGVILGPGGLVTHGHRFFPGDAPGYLGALSATRAVSAVTAACLVVEARKFERVGGFDAAAFAVDFNDVDLCLRLNAAGHRSLFVPGAVLNHYEAASRRWTPTARARHVREVAALKERWGPLLTQDPHYHPGFDPDLGTYARARPGWTGAVSPR